MRFPILIITALIYMFQVSTPKAEIEDQAKFYVGKTVRLIVGYGAGGGYDAFARLIAPELERSLRAKVVVQNSPGGGGLTVLNKAVHARSDGLSLTVANVSSAVAAQLLTSEAARFNVRDFVWIGASSSDERVLVLAEGVSLNSFIARPQVPHIMRWAAGGKTDNLALSAAAFSEAFGLNSKIITGYKGTSEAIAALLRGEAEAAVVSIESASVLTSATGLTMAAILAEQRAPAAPDLPTVYETEHTQANRPWLDYMTKLSGLGRAIIAPPGTPSDRVDFLRMTLKKILLSDSLAAAAARQSRTIKYVDPLELTNTVDDMLNSDSDGIGKDLIFVLTEKYF